MHRESNLARRARRYRIVVGVDLSEYADIVIDHALDQAARHQTPELHFLTVRERRRPTSDELKQELWERVYPALEAFNRHAADWRARLHIRRGKPDEQLGALAADLRADLIVIGHFGLHHPKRSLSGLPSRVLHQAVCPTLVVGMPEELDMQQCPMCTAVREDSEGDTWFCTEHTSSNKKVQVSTTPMTVWSRGAFAIDRAA
jgi:nucleotide-binding universal stress UspA family protein